jgi:NAD(P)-dependent dehydrogenase (short-subunit alcohol dehydrogenase family)
MTGGDMTGGDMTGRAIWSLADLPDLTGKTVMVTGCTNGVGRYAALELARGGGRVIMAARNEVRLAETSHAISQAVPAARIERLVVDLSELESVRRAAGVAAAYGPIDVLINNAGIMAVPYARTRDGLESQMATNHFGPFLLTGLLLPQLLASGAGRVVTQASSAHRSARVAPLTDPRDTDPTTYRRAQVYAQSKLANLLFTFELDRRARDAGLPLTALAAHPGLAATNLMPDVGGPGVSAILNAAVRAVGQPASVGALPILMAATADLPGSTYCGPSGWGPRGIGEFRGPPTIVSASSLARNRDAQRQLWELSESVVGLAYP